MFSAGIWAVVFYGITLIASLSIPAYYWTDDIKPIKQAIDKARELMGGQQYPVGSDSTKVENRLLYAVVIDRGKKYAKQINKKKYGKKLVKSSTILANTDFVMDADRNITHYSADNDGDGSSGGSSSGGGGAGAF